MFDSKSSHPHQRAAVLDQLIGAYIAEKNAPKPTATCQHCDAVGEIPRGSSFFKAAKEILDDKK